MDPPSAFSRPAWAQRLGRVVGRGRWFAVEHRLSGFVVLLLPFFLVLGFDVYRRGSRLLAFHPADWPFYWVTGSVGALVWAVLLLGAAKKNGVWRQLSAILFVVFFTLSVGGQSYFFQQYNAYLTEDVSRFATDFSESVLHQLIADLGNYLAVKAPVFVLAVALVFLARRNVVPAERLETRASALGIVALLLAFFLPTQHRERQAATPDMLYMNAMGGMARTLLGLTEQSHQLRPRPRKSLSVPALVPRPERPRNVVFVLLESVRADAACVEYSDDCRFTEATNHLFPERFPLKEMRALDSTTAISLAVLWSGVGPHESRDVLHTAPLLFDYARQAGYHTAYWTSQNMMFGNVRLWVDNLGVESFVHATMVDPTSDIDLGAPEGSFADYTAKLVPTLKEPFFLTVQLSNVHYPYLVEENGPKPFQPALESKAPEDGKAFRNFYQNAVYQQDQHLGRLLAALKNAPSGERTVFVVTSDHGEAFREHYQMGHTFSMFDEEVKVPAYVAAAPGTLAPSEVENLSKNRDRFAVHPDLTATMLDLLGVWDDPKLSSFRKKMPGESLLDGEVSERALAMTNCAGVWSCAFENWGYLKGAKKLEARAWDPAYHCYDLTSDPGEKRDLGEGACGELLDLAKKEFGRLPGKKRD